MHTAPTAAGRGGVHPNVKRVLPTRPPPPLPPSQAGLTQFVGFTKAFVSPRQLNVKLHEAEPAQPTEMLVEGPLSVTAVPLPPSSGVGFGAVQPGGDGGGGSSAAPDLDVDAGPGPGDDCGPACGGGHCGDDDEPEELTAGARTLERPGEDGEHDLAAGTKALKRQSVDGGMDSGAPKGGVEPGGASSGGEAKRPRLDQPAGARSRKPAPNERRVGLTVLGCGTRVWY